jgi:glycosyl transferase family 25
MDVLSNFPLPLFILKSAAEDRSTNVLSEFNEKDEFRILSDELLEYNVGTISLISSMLLNMENEYVVLCRADHIFTQAYSRTRLMEMIGSMENKNIELALGGLGGFETIVPLGEDLTWVDWFAYATMMILSKKLCRKIVKGSLEESKDQDLLSAMTINKAVISPYISVSKPSDETVYIKGQKYCNLNYLYAMSEERVNKNTAAFKRFNGDKLMAAGDKYYIGNK